MPTQKTVTFRTETIGRISDLIQAEGLTCQASQNVLSYLAGALLNYRHEGVELSPSVLFCQDAEAVLQSFPGAVRHSIGEAGLTADSAERVLKECAPLATHNWYIYIERSGPETLRFGVFSYFELPTTLRLYEMIAISPNTFCLLLRKTGPGTIQIDGSRGNSLSLIFSTVRETGASTDNPIAAFAADCCRDVEDSPNTAGFGSYFSRLLCESVGKCHGTMLVCTATPNAPLVQELTAGILLRPKLDFLAAFVGYRSIGSADSILTLQRCEALLNGILQCDGIVVFDTAGSVIAYRVIYRPADADNQRSGLGQRLRAIGRRLLKGGQGQIEPDVGKREDLPQTGGTRRRAFEGIRSLVSASLVSALFRSQDGLTIRAGGAQ